MFPHFIIKWNTALIRPQELLHGGVQGQDGWDPGQTDLVPGDSAYNSGLELDDL